MNWEKPFSSNGLQINDDGKEDDDDDDDDDDGGAYLYLCTNPIFHRLEPLGTIIKAITK